MNVLEDEVLKDLNVILSRPPFKRDHRGPTRLLDHLYMGNIADASIKGSARLRQLGITHVISLNASKSHDTNPYPPESGVRVFLEFFASDHDSYNILQHFDDAKDAIDDAKKTGGCALVHCALGINRSAAICVAYLMLDQRLPLQQAVEYVKDKRGVVLVNKGFQRQLIRFAQFYNLLPPVFYPGVAEATFMHAGMG